MSTYQYIYFAAVDRALDDKQLAYMRCQSTRADVTRWQFENEYHFGAFSGNAMEMMRCGYDVHLHYANYGTRELLFRLPYGLPVTRTGFKLYELGRSLEWKKGTRGKGGVLSICPESDAGDYGEDYFEFDRLIAILPKVRALLIAGDLRPLYLAWLACVWDDDAIEPPVPAGLKKHPVELKELADFYAVSPDLIRAAASESASLPPKPNASSTIDDWIDKRPSKELRLLLRRVLDGEGANVQAESLAAIRREGGTARWPTKKAGRTREELKELAAAKRAARESRELKAEQKARDKRLKAIAAKPADAILKSQKLVEVRSTDNYFEAASILAELRDALGPEKGPKCANAAAKKLVHTHPTLSYLKKALREQGLSYK